VSDASNEHLEQLLRLRRFPRPSTYDPAWIVENQMGPNALWFTEFLCEAMDLRPGMRVLDLGCGKALSSIFLAREFGVQVWATDLWIPATENAGRIRAASLEDRVFPIHADARNLPFANGFFDAIVSIDAFEYFGTDALYLPSLVQYLKPDCRVGIVNAGALREVDVLPEEWPSDFCTFHTPEWWRRHWSVTRCVEVEAADNLPGSRELWLRWNRAIGFSEDTYLTSSAGENLAFHRIVARRTA
jgi:cyclopropane fatty-acyl-phospholipid synthase-like methyltransferase